LAFVRIKRVDGKEYCVVPILYYFVRHYTTPKGEADAREGRRYH
jgi:hypothetical protein